MPGPLTKSITAILRDAAEARGLTQQQVADAIGQSQSQVSRYFSGEVTMDAEEIYKACRFIGISIVDLIATADRDARDADG